MVILISMPVEMIITQLVSFISCRNVSVYPSMLVYTIFDAANRMTTRLVPGVAYLTIAYTDTLQVSRNRSIFPGALRGWH